MGGTINCKYILLAVFGILSLLLLSCHDDEQRSVPIESESTTLGFALLLRQYQNEHWNEAVNYKMVWDQAVLDVLPTATPIPVPTPTSTRTARTIESESPSAPSSGPTYLVGGVPDIIRAAFYAAGQAQWAEFAVGVSWCESNWDPAVVNYLGATGIFQLLPSGQLDEFYIAGYTDPYSPYQQAEFVANYIAVNQWWGPWEGCI